MTMSLQSNGIKYSFIAFFTPILQGVHAPLGVLRTDDDPAEHA